VGRLLRKKDPGQKKKKKSAPESAGDSEGRTASAPPPADTAERKRQVIPLRNPLGEGIMASAAGRDNWFGRSVQFLREVKVELKKVAWPTRKQTMGSTAVVLILVMIISLFLGLVDIGLSSLLQLVLG